MISTKRLATLANHSLQGRRDVGHRRPIALSEQTQIFIIRDLNHIIQQFYLTFDPHKQ